jgi:hypothetical protein
MLPSQVWQRRCRLLRGKTFSIASISRFNSALIVVIYSAHIMVCLEDRSGRAHHFQHNHAEEAMDSIGNYSTEKNNFARIRAATEPPC